LSIQAIIWDMEGVLLLTRGGSMPAVIAEQLGAPYDETKELFFGEFNDRVDLGEFSQDDFWNHILDKLGKPRSMKNLLIDFFYNDQYIDQDLLDTIRSHRNRYRTGMITNFSEGMREMFEGAWSVDGAFDEIIISCEVGIVKPDPRIYHLMLERLGCSPEEAVFIDDRPNNIEGAENIGMNTVLFENREQALEELEDIIAKNP